MKMKKYEKPNLEIKVFEALDIITASPTDIDEILDDGKTVTKKVNFNDLEI